MDRRTYIKGATAVSATGLPSLVAGCMGEEETEPDDVDDGPADANDEPAGADDDANEGDDDTGEESPGELDEVHIVWPEGALDSLVPLYGSTRGAWEEHGIDISVEIAPFEKFTRAVATELTDVGGIPVPAAINFALEGEPITWIGQGVSFANYMVTMAGSPIEEPPDVADNVLGIPFAESSTTVGYRAMMDTAYGLDIMEDPAETVPAAPPVLWELMHEGEIDAAIQFAGFSVRAEVEEDVQILFDPVEYWREEFGAVPQLVNLATRRPFIEESEDNADLALRFKRGWGEAVEIFTEEADQAIQNYGLLAGLETEEEAEVVVRRVEDGVQFGPTEFTEEVADANWLFAEQMHDAGVFEELPDKDQMVMPVSELEDLAGR